MESGRGVAQVSFVICGTPPTDEIDVDDEIDESLLVSRCSSSAYATLARARKDAVCWECPLCIFFLFVYLGLGFVFGNCSKGSK